MQPDNRSKLIRFVLFPIVFGALVMVMVMSASPTVQAENGTPPRDVHPSAPNNVYTVNSSSDLIAIPTCAGAAGDCSLRGAVQKAIGGDTINISPAVTMISVGSPITLTVNSITLHGNGQEVTNVRTTGNFPALVINSSNNEIDGFWIRANASHVGTAQHGIVINGSNNYIQHNSLSDLGGDGVLIQNGSGNALQYNVIGVQTLNGQQWATCAFHNDQWGVQIINGTNNVLRHNAIGCSGLDGVIISGALATGNLLSNNTVGIVNWGGFVPNTLAGVAVLGGADFNAVGNAQEGGNVIGANGSYGVYIADTGTNGNTVALNSIGITGTTNISNTGDGVSIQSGATANQVLTNTIADNAYTGVYLYNSSGNVVRGNSLHNQVTNGVLIQGGSGQTIEQNVIGIKTNGATQLTGCDFGNGQSGIRINDSAQNKVLNNTIGCNVADGIGLAGAGANGNEVYGNSIGVINGGGRVTNTLSGVAVMSGAHDNLIGLPTAGNIIGASGVYGVYISDSGTNNNSVQLNSIGISGTINIGNLQDGVIIRAGAQFNQVVTNTITDNTDNGVFLTGASTAFNELRGNTIRLNGLLNGKAGVRIDSGAAFNSIGVFGNRAAGNVISANWNGVYIDGATTSYNVVYGNNIGTNAAGNAADGNQGAGVTLDNGTYGNVIGWLATERNVISGNYQDGMIILNGAHDNSVRSNDIGLNRDYSPAADISPASISDLAKPAGGGGPFVDLHNFYGIWLGAAYTNTIGGYIGGTPAANYIFYNHASGIILIGGSQHNVIDLNVISNSGQDGVSLFDVATTSNIITRTLIDHSFRAGIVEDVNVSGNVWSEVGISASGELGIDMGGYGVTIPYVFIDSINRATGVVSGHGHATDGVLDITQVELYRVSPNPSGYGEGQTFIGRATTDASGNWTITDTSPSNMRGCYTAFITESHPLALVPAYSSEFSANTCRVFLPQVVKN